MTGHNAGLPLILVLIAVAVVPFAACGSSVRVPGPSGQGGDGMPADYPVTILDSTEHRNAMAAAWARFFDTYGVPPDRRRVPDLAPVTHTPTSFLGIGPVRLLATSAPGATVDEEQVRLLLREFIARNGELFGVAANSLSLEGVASAGQSAKRYDFVQAAYPFPIASPYGRLSIIVTDAGEIIQIDDTAIPVGPLPREPRITREAAQQRVVGMTFTYADIAGREQKTTVDDAAQVVARRLVVYPELTEAAMRVRLAWEVEAGSGMMWTVYVDAIDGSVVGTRQNFQT
jgi:hypothetical protein